MDFTCDERPSDSPFIERVWRSQGEPAGTFVSMSQAHCEMVVTRHQGKITLTVRGPETRATPAHCPADTEFIGIQFRVGAFLRLFPARMVLDRQDVNLPEATGQSFWLHGSAWQFPSFENADTFVNRLVRDGLLVNDPIVDAVLEGQPLAVSPRTIQRRFLQATGMTYGTFGQIERARSALSLLKQGVSILDTVHEAGYADQPHLTRAMKHFIGQTPAQITDENRSERLSFLFKTTPLLPGYADSIDQRKEQSLEKNHRRRVFIPGWRDGSAAKLALPLHQR